MWTTKSTPIAADGLLRERIVYPYICFLIRLLFFFAPSRLVDRQCWLGSVRCVVEGQMVGYGGPRRRSTGALWSCNLVVGGGSRGQDGAGGVEMGELEGIRVMDGPWVGAHRDFRPPGSPSASVFQLIRTSPTSSVPSSRHPSPSTMIQPG